MVKLLFFFVLLQLGCLYSQGNLFVTLRTAKFLATTCLFTGEFAYSGPLFIDEFFHTDIFVHSPICSRRFLCSPAYFSKFRLCSEMILLIVCLGSQAIFSGAVPLFTNTY